MCVVVAAYRLLAPKEHEVKELVEGQNTLLGRRKVPASRGFRVRFAGHDRTTFLASGYF